MGDRWPTVMVTGHRAYKTVNGRRVVVLTPEQQVWVRAKLSACAVWLRDNRGTTIGVSGMACGADLYWAQAVVDAGLDLHAYIPFPQQADPWPETDRAEWRRLLNLAAKVVPVGDLDGVAPSRRKAEAVRLLHERNDWMLAATAAHRGAVVAVLKLSATSGGTHSAATKALRRGLPVIRIEPETRSVTLPNKGR